MISRGAAPALLAGLLPALAPPARAAPKPTLRNSGPLAPVQAGFAQCPRNSAPPVLRPDHLPASDQTSFALRRLPSEG